MTRLRAAQLWSGYINSTTPTTVITVPAGHKYIIKRITCLNVGSAGACQVRLASFGTWWTFWLSAYGSTGARDQLDTFVVLEPGDQLQVNELSASGGFTLVISGSDMLI